MLQFKNTISRRREAKYINMPNKSMFLLAFVCCFALLGCSPTRSGLDIGATKSGDSDIGPGIRKLCLNLINEIEGFVFDKGDFHEETVNRQINELEKMIRPDEFEPRTQDISDKERLVVSQTISLAEEAITEDWKYFFDTYEFLRATFSLNRSIEHDQEKIADSILYENFVKQIYHRGSLNFTVGESKAAVKRVNEIKQSSSIEISELIPSREDIRRVKVTYQFESQLMGDRSETVIMEWLPRDVYEYEIVDVVSNNMATSSPSAVEPEPEIRYVTVVSDDAQIRETSSDNGAVLSTALKGDRIRWTGRTAREVMTGRKWYLVTLDDGGTGYMDGKDIEETNK